MNYITSKRRFLRFDYFRTISQQINVSSNTLNSRSRGNFQARSRKPVTMAFDLYMSQNFHIICYITGLAQMQWCISQSTSNITILCCGWYKMCFNTYNLIAMLSNTFFNVLGVSFCDKIHRSQDKSS